MELNVENKVRFYHKCLLNVKWYIFFKETRQLVRLVGSNYNNQGQVELYINGTWTGICSEFWDDNDASVVCNQLGYSREGIFLISLLPLQINRSNLYCFAGARAFSGGYNSRRSILIGVLNCSGTEQTLSDCSYSSISSCNRYSAASIMCQSMFHNEVTESFINRVLFWTDNPLVTSCSNDDVRIIGGPTALEGTVEICRNRVWGGICHSRWYNRDANVVCSQLGFQPTGKSLVDLS